MHDKCWFVVFFFTSVSSHFKQGTVSLGEKPVCQRKIISQFTIQGLILGKIFRFFRFSFGLENAGSGTTWEKTTLSKVSREWELAIGQRTNKEVFEYNFCLTVKAVIGSLFQTLSEIHEFKSGESEKSSTCIDGARWQAGSSNKPRKYQHC